LTWSERWQLLGTVWYSSDEEMMKKATKIIETVLYSVISSSTVSYEQLLWVNWDLSVCMHVLRGFYVFIED